MFEVNFVEEDLKEIIRGFKQKNKKLKKENKELREQLEKERELYYGDDDFAEDDWGRE